MIKKIILVLFLFNLTLSVFGQIQRDSTITFYGNKIYIDTLLPEFDYHVKISFKETFKTVKEKRKYVAYKEWNLDSIKSKLLIELNKLNISSEVNLIEISDSKKIHNINSKPITLFEGVFELYINSKSDIHKVFNTLYKEFEDKVLIGFTAVPYVDNVIMSRAHNLSRNKAYEKANQDAQKFADKKAKELLFVHIYSSNYSTYKWTQNTPAYEYGDKKIFINMKKPKITSTWTYEITLKK